MKNVEKLVTAIRGRKTTAKEIDEKELMKVIKSTLSKKEALIIEWKYGLNGNEPKEFKDIPLQQICSAGIDPTKLICLESVALGKLGVTRVLNQYCKSLE